MIESILSFFFLLIETVHLPFTNALYLCNCVLHWLRFFLCDDLKMVSQNRPQSSTVRCSPLHSSRQSSYSHQAQLYLQLHHDLNCRKELAKSVGSHFFDTGDYRISLLTVALYSVWAVFAKTLRLVKNVYPDTEKIMKFIIFLVYTA